MKRSRIASLMALLSLTHNIAQAEVITDLPDPGIWDDITADVSSTPTTPNQDVTPVQTEYAGSLKITSMSRKSGGTLYQMPLQKALILNRLEIKVENQRLKVHSARVLTEGGRIITVREFADSRILNTGDVLVSENLNLSEKISSIELTAESYGGSADISVQALSNYEVPKMTLKPAQSAESTTRPSNPPPPPGSTIKEQPSAPVKPAPPVVQAPTAQDTRPAPIGRGTAILYSNSYVGEIVDIINSNTVRVRLDGYSGTHDVERRLIATKTNCLDNLCSGYNILYSHNYAGMIRTIFSNKKAQVVLDGYSGLHIVDLSQLSPSVNCLKNFCQGQSALYNNTYEATIKTMYASGRVLVTLAGYSGSHFVDISQLSKVLTCSGGFCVGETVMYSSTYKGKVLKIYGNNQAQVSLDGYSGTHVVSISQLSRPVSCAQGICVGDRIVYSRNYQGSVVAVYNNGTAQVALSGYSGTHNVNLRDLIKIR